MFWPFAHSAAEVGTPGEEDTPWLRTTHIQRST